MKEKWSKGKHGGTVVSDRENPHGEHGGQDYYGGYLVAESIPTRAYINLIAAAPDMLEACKDALDRLRHVATVEPHLNGYGARRETIELLNEVIARAEGRL